MSGKRLGISNVYFFSEEGKKTHFQVQIDRNLLLGINNEGVKNMITAEMISNDRNVLMIHNCFLHLWEKISGTSNAWRFMQKKSYDMH